MRLVWTDTANADARSIVTYIARANPDAAISIRNKLDSAAQKLTKRNTGRISRMMGLYEKSVLGTQFILAYSVSNDAIEIIRIMHTAQNWTADSFPE